MTLPLVQMCRYKVNLHFIHIKNSQDYFFFMLKMARHFYTIYSFFFPQMIPLSNESTSLSYVFFTLFCMYCQYVMIVAPLFTYFYTFTSRNVLDLHSLE